MKNLKNQSKIVKEHLAAIAEIAAAVQSEEEDRERKKAAKILKEFCNQTKKFDREALKKSTRLLYRLFV
jgi:hypothetical protein